VHGVKLYLFALLNIVWASCLEPVDGDTYEATLFACARACPPTQETDPEMTLPEFPEQIIQPGELIPASVLNAIQLAIVSVASGEANTQEVDIGDGIGAGQPQQDISLDITAIGIHQIGLPVRTGHRIREIRIYGSADAGATMTVQYRTRKIGQVVVVEDSLVWGGGPAEVEALKVIDVATLYPPDGLIVQADVQHALYISVTGAGDTYLHKRTVVMDAVAVTSP
jgi:hypothetical protein